LSDRKVDVACIQETQWKGSGCKFYGAKGQRYKLFWMGGEQRSDSEGIFVAQKWVDSVVSVEKHRKRVLILKMVLTHTHTHNRFTALLEFVRDYPGEQIER